MTNKLNYYILILFLSLPPFACKKVDEKVKTESVSNSIVDIKVYTDPKFTLMDYPELVGVVILDPDDTFLKYIEDDLRKKASNAWEYRPIYATSCGEFIPDKNLFRFRSTGRKFDIHLKFLSKKGDFFYLTNESETKILRFKMIYSGNYKDPTPVFREFEFYALNSDTVLDDGRAGIDYTTYEECVTTVAEIAEIQKNNSSYDIVGPEKEEKNK
ncbi:MAG: hypothetical protein SH817_15380 [Leptospira sp.]|nr:hypothetical protein [Leptospira sp.]